MNQDQRQLRKATPRQIAGVSGRAMLCTGLAFAGTLVAAVPFLMQFAKSCPGLPVTTEWLFSIHAPPCGDVIAGALIAGATRESWVVSLPGIQFILSAFLMFAMIGALKRRRARIASRRDEE